MHLANSFVSLLPCIACPYPYPILVLGILFICCYYVLKSYIVCNNWKSVFACKKKTVHLCETLKFDFPSLNVKVCDALDLLLCTFPYLSVCLVDCTSRISSDCYVPPWE